MNKSKISIAIINSVAALVCCVAVAVAGTAITSRVCDNQKAMAEVSASAGVADGGDSSYSDTVAGDASSDISNDTAADSNASSDIAADAAVDSAESDSSTDTTSQDADNKTTKTITATSGLQSNDKAEVLKYYQLVAAKNESKTYKTTMTLKSLDGGEGGIGSFISMFEPVAKRALAKNSNEGQGVPGKPELIKISDWKSATAVNDGTYTTLNIQIVPQTDGANGKVHEGTVGRSIGVLDGIQTAVEQLDGLTADFENGKITLNYKDAYIKVKIKNSTGEFVKGACEWHHEVNVDIARLDAKMLFSVKLRNSSGVVDYKVNY